MKTRMSERATQPVTLPILASFERHDQIERAIRQLGASDGDHTGIFFARRRTHTAFVWVSWKELNQFRVGAREMEHVVNGFDGDDPLVIAVPTGVVIGP